MDAKWLRSLCFTRFRQVQNELGRFPNHDCHQYASHTSPDQHCSRIRGAKHERRNWASHVHGLTSRFGLLSNGFQRHLVNFEWNRFCRLSHRRSHQPVRKQHELRQFLERSDWKWTGAQQRRYNANGNGNFGNERHQPCCCSHILSIGSVFSRIVPFIAFHPIQHL